MEPKVAIRLFDHLSVHCGDRELLLHSSSHAKEILCYLIVKRRGSVTRDTLAGLIASNSPDEKARKVLRQALWQLRSGLSDETHTCSGRLLSFGSGWAQFKQGGNVWLDVDDFEHAASSSKRDAYYLPPEPERIARAVEIYRGDFLQGWHQDWCERERERLKQILLEMLDLLVAHCEAQQQLHSGMIYATRALEAESVRIGP